MTWLRRGYPAILSSETVWAASGTAAGSSFSTSGVEYVPLVQGAADEIAFQFVSPVASGSVSFDVIYAMSVANGGDIDLRLDRLILAEDSDPDVALTSGTVATFTPGSDVLVHTASHANFDMTAPEGSIVFAKLVRPNTDTHTGDVRIIDIKLKRAS